MAWLALLTGWLVLLVIGGLAGDMMDAAAQQGNDQRETNGSDHER